MSETVTQQQFVVFQILSEMLRIILEIIIHLSDSDPKPCKLKMDGNALVSERKQRRDQSRTMSATYDF